MNCWNIAVLIHASDGELAVDVRSRLNRAWDSTPPAAITILTFEANRRMGPYVAGALFTVAGVVALIVV